MVESRLAGRCSMLCALCIVSVWLIGFLVYLIGCVDSISRATPLELLKLVIRFRFTTIGLGLLDEAIAVATMFNVDQNSLEIPLSFQVQSRCVGLACKPL